MTKSYKATYFPLLAVVLLWGFNWPMNKIAMDYMPAIWHATLRLAFGCLSMFLFVLVAGKFKIPSKKDLPLIFMMGTVQMGVFSLLINLGLNQAGAGRSAILVYTVPLWVTPLAMMLFKEKMNLLKFSGLVFGLFGIFILLSPWQETWSRETLYGDGVLLLAALTMAVSICCSRNMVWRSTPLELLPWQLLAATLPIWLLATIVVPKPAIDWNMVSAAAMAYTAIFATAVGYLCFTMVSRALSSITVSLGLLGVPLIGVLSAALILGEEVTGMMKMAMACIFSGLILVVWSGNGKKEQSSLPVVPDNVE